MSEAVCAFLGCEGVEQLADPVPEAVPGALGGLAQERLEFGEDHFDGIEVRGVRRQVNEPGADGLDQLAPARNLVGGQIVITTMSPLDKFGASTFST